MKHLLMSKALALSLEQSRAHYIESWLEAMRSQPGNPYGVDIYRLGQVRAFVACGLPEIGLFHRVMGLGPEHKGHVDEIQHFYHDHGIQHYFIDINPYHADSHLLNSLMARGFSQSLFQTYLYAIPVPTGWNAHSAVQARDITDSEVALFADLHIAGFREALAGMPEKTVQAYHDCTMLLYQHPGWHLSFSLMHGQPVGIGMLYIASLAGGATLGQFRGNGSQTASLQHRIALAAQAQCTLVVGQASVGSRSQRNMEKANMYTAYTEITWTPVEC